VSDDLSAGLLVLRFRDLSVNPGETILKHRVTIAKHGSCWWGWWKRNHEVNPSEVLSGLTFPRPVALYDTDQGVVHRAYCTGARCSPEPSLSPRVDRTPSYYNNRRLLAWFELTVIEEWDPGVIVGRRCLYMPLADTADVGWIVTDLLDLRRRQETMWLLSQKGDG
jgi:hypothetical protein